jgi:hypothetical protein
MPGSLSTICALLISRKSARNKWRIGPPNCQENIEKFFDLVQVAEKVFGHIVI